MGNAKLTNTIYGAIMLAVLWLIIYYLNTTVITGTDTGSTNWRTITNGIGAVLSAIGVAILIIRAVLA